MRDKQSGSEMLARLNAGLRAEVRRRQVGARDLGAGASSSTASSSRRRRSIARRSTKRRAGSCWPSRASTVVYTRSELERGSRAGAPFFDAMRKTWDRERSGDLQFALKPYWMMTSSTSTTTHGSPHPYDTQRADPDVRPAVDRAPAASTRRSRWSTSRRRWRDCSAWRRRPASEGKPLPLRSPATSP